jgi:hypothetical protein
MRKQRLKFGQGGSSRRVLLPAGLFLVCAVLVTAGVAVWVPLVVVAAGAVYPGPGRRTGHSSCTEVV